MSSTIRIKRSNYSSLRENTESNDPSSRISITQWSGPSQPTAPNPQNTETSRRALQRPRAASVVEGHCRYSPQYPTVQFQRSPLPPDTSRPSTPVPVGPSIAPAASVSSLPRSHATTVPVEIVGSDDHHHDNIVEHLDVIDPQVATISNLANAANSILMYYSIPKLDPPSHQLSSPPLSWYSRKPVVVIAPPTLRRNRDPEKGQQFEDDLDRHVDDVLNRPSKVRRTLKGVWSFLKTPMGIITGIYGFLVVFWGAAIVLFLAKIINLHNPVTQGFWVEVSSQVTNGLFTVTGIGLIPSRVLDTYRMTKIWKYKRRTRKLREQAGLPQLFDPDDLPDPMYDPNYVHVLSDEEQADLHRQQVLFQHNQSFYRSHGTETHRAFPVSIALWICFLNDGNSFFQILLCATMWGLNRFQRPAWSTGTLIPASFLCGIASAVLIAYGGKKTKRTEEVEQKLRAILLAERKNYGNGEPLEHERVESPKSLQSPLHQVPEKELAIEEHMSVPDVKALNA